MKNKDDLTGKFARLPDGQKVIIESVSDGFATVRRIEGPYRKKLAVCRIDKLKPA